MLCLFSKGGSEEPGNQCNANIVKYTKQVVGQIYRYLDGVKVIKKRKPQKSMETNVLMS